MSAEPIAYETVMQCGHVANGYRVRGDARTACCVICSCEEPASTQPDLAARVARCSYFGKAAPMTMRNRGHCPTRTRDDQTCRCERPSAPSLWFFEHKPDAAFDTFYCSCFGDD